MATNDPEEEVPPLELGDRILIQGGTYDNTRGRIYYLDDTLFSILPDGVTNRVIQLPLKDGDFDPELGIEGIYPLSRRTSEKFVDQINAYKGQLAETFDVNGQPGLTYTIKEVNTAEDKIVLEDETGAVKELDFTYGGIPRDEEFVVLRPRLPASDVELEGEAEEEGEEEDPFQDIETPPEVKYGGIIEIPESLMSYSDTIQRNDMLDDFLSVMKAAGTYQSEKQKKKIRQFVEQCMMLRNDVTVYSQSGDPVGQNSTSFQTVMEMINKGDIPLARPVLDAKRTLYLDMTDSNATSIPGLDVDLMYDPNTLRAAIDFQKNQMAASSEQNFAPDSLPSWFLNWEIFFKRYAKSWISDSIPGEGVSFRGDKEFLRAPVPKVDEETGLFEKEVDALMPLQKALDGGLGAEGEGAAAAAAARTVQEDYTDAIAERMDELAAEEGGGAAAAGADEEGGPATKEAPAPKRKKTKIADLVLTADYIGKTGISLLKGIGPRYTRLKSKDGQRRIESGDEGVIVNQLIFPLSTEKHLGSTRSGKLLKDIAYSTMSPKGIAQILREMGGVPDVATAGGIISIGAGGNTLGNIGIDEWLKAQPIFIGGLGEALIDLKSLGLSQRELTADQQAVLIDKINQYRGLVNGVIKEAREKAIKAKTTLKLTNSPFLQGPSLENFMAIIKEEPLLAAYAEDIRRRLPAYRENDIALFSAMQVQMSDLLLTAIAGHPGPLARERNRQVQDRYIDTLQKVIARFKKREAAGVMPEKIQCPHVDSLTAIRKVADLDDRMQLLARFIALYKKRRYDNWLWCTSSGNENEHKLLCYHEELLLQEYLHPNEKDAIHKELLLGFSGIGTSGGKYICKNCGQPISDQAFDSSMEFDDEGRPMAGRAVMVDKDAISEEEMKAILEAPIEETTEITFETESKTIIFRAAKDVFDALGIFCDMESYRRIIERVDAEIKRFPSREMYAKMIKAEAANATKKGLKPRKAVDYDLKLNQLFVSVLGANILIEIQAKIPDFEIRYRIPGCRAGFSGFPLGDEKDLTGLEYITCAIASITKATKPWSLTGYQAIRTDKGRQDEIKPAIQKVLTSIYKSPNVQVLFIQKKAYLEAVKGIKDVTVRIPEAVGEGFRPIPYFVTAEEATKDMIVPQAANPEERVRAWIQTAHVLARKNGTYVSGSPFAETSCCFTPIGQPKGFWLDKAASLPELPVKTPPRGQAGSQTIATFRPRRLAKLIAETPDNLFYRVFLNVCFDGPRKGYPHEPGYNNICYYCGFQFPENPFTSNPIEPLSESEAANIQVVKDWRAKQQEIAEKGKVALTTQKVLVDRATFQDLLDTTHRNYRVEVPAKKKVILGADLLKALAAIEPEPFQGWRALMAQTIEGISRLPEGGPADETSIAEAYSALSDHIVSVLGDFTVRFGMGSSKTMQGILKQSPGQIVETVRTYFLVPFQRLLVGFNRTSFRVKTTYKLPTDAQEDINNAMKGHLEYLDSIKPFVNGYAKIKLQEVKSQLTRVLPIIQNKLRANLIPGGGFGIGYLVGSLVLGILGEFINPNVIPESAASSTVRMGGSLESNSRMPLNILEVCLTKVKVEGLDYTEDQIRDVIARRAEMEKNLIIKKLELPPEEKAMAMRIKRLGLKEWATGSKNVYSLNAEQYEHDRMQRIQMGAEGAFERGDTETAGIIQRMEYGDNYGGGGMGAEAGFDVAQYGADDF